MRRKLAPNSIDPSAPGGVLSMFHAAASRPYAEVERALINPSAQELNVVLAIGALDRPARRKIRAMKSIPEDTQGDAATSLLTLDELFEFSGTTH